MICKKCGKEVNDTDKFCEFCGNNLTKKSISELIKEHQKLCIGLLITFVLLIIGGLYLAYYNTHPQFINPYQKNLAKIGAYIKQENNKFIITDFIKDSPSDKSDLRKGDLILKINNKNIDKLSLNKICALLQGQAGTEVKIQVLRDGKKVIVTVPRENVGEYYDYFYNGKSIYTKYLKYEKGKYYFWMKADGRNSNFGIKNYGYGKVLSVIDLKKQEIGYIQMDLYDKNNNLVQSFKEPVVETIRPDTFGYSLYEMIKRIDDNSTDKEKEQFKGFLE